MNLGKFRFLFSLAVSLAAWSVSAGSSHAAVVFTETFSVNDSNWKNNGSTAPTYFSTGGDGGSGGYISTPYTVPSSVGGNGVVLMRAQDEFNSSGNAFVRNWIAEGINSFSIALKSDSTVPLNLNIRFSTPANTPGASTQNFVLPVSSDWQTITIPIIDSVSTTPGAGVFQTYGGGSFNTIFSNIGHIQVSLANITGLTTGETINLGIDSPSISAVPEPGSIALGCMGIAGAGLMLRRRMKKQAA